MDIKRDINENEFEYVKRIVYGKLKDRTIKTDFEDLSEFVFGEGNAYNKDEVRKRFYGMKFLLELIDKYNIELSKSDEEILRKIEEKTREMEKMKFQYQDQKREYRNLLKEEARWEHLRNEIIREFKKEGYIKPFTIEKDCFDNSKDREAILCLSDWHVGMEFNSKVNDYNLPIARERIEKLTNETLKYCKINQVNTLHINLLGDFIHGIIHNSARVMSQEDVISQVKHTCEFLYEMLKVLDNKIPNIKIHYTVGNHGRISQNKKDSISAENFERLLPWRLELEIKQLNNVEIVDNEYQDIIKYKIFDYNIFGMHGHNEKDVASSMLNMVKVTGIKPDIITMGHLHKDFRTENGAVIIVNGSLCGTDDYAYDKRLVSKPHQKLIIMGKDEGEICTYKIILN